MPLGRSKNTRRNSIQWAHQLLVSADGDNMGENTYIIKKTGAVSDASEVKVELLL
jgi:hypothetical protein